MLRTRGLKATPRRVLILRTLEKAKRPLPVEALRVLLKGSVNEVTIYRALEALEQEGIVMRISLRNARGYYELTPLGSAHHHHLVCNRCGDIEDVEVPEPKDLEKTILAQSKNFKEITSHSLEFFGKCRACVRA